MSLRRSQAGPCGKSRFEHKGEMSVVPKAPSDFADVGVEREILTGLGLKFAFTVQHFTTEWMIKQLCLPQAMVMVLLEELKAEKLVEVLGESGTFNFLFRITDQGREHAIRILEISGYVGPAPVSLDAYTALLESQFDDFPKVSPSRTETALSGLVLSDEDKELIGLALMSGRTLFIHGPSGNGKTSVGRMLHGALVGCLWIPHCIAVDTSIIRLFDPLNHKPVPLESSHEEAGQIDRRWVRIERPLIVVGGELTMDALDLGYDSALKSYEAPLHLKANGGTFLLDDFGRQRIESSQLLNRWIIPLESRVDYLTMRSGKKIQVPVQQMLVISTGLDPDEVVDPAFMRRMGYRLYLGEPSRERFGRIFEQYASRYDTSLPPNLIERLLARYTAEDRPLRSCEPRDLIERARDICRYRSLPLELNDEVIDLAWKGYFGERERSAGNG